MDAMVAPVLIAMLWRVYSVNPPGFNLEFTRFKAGLIRYLPPVTVAVPSTEI